MVYLNIFSWLIIGTLFKFNCIISYIIFNIILHLICFAHMFEIKWKWPPHDPTTIDIVI
jgi:hypothetical protein